MPHRYRHSVQAHRRLWASPSLAGRISEAWVRWDLGLPVHAVQQLQVATAPAASLVHWQLSDEGPRKDEEGFSSEPGKQNGWP